MEKDANPAFGAHLMPYARITSFMRQPATRDLDGVDVAIVRIPFDSGTSSFRIRISVASGNKKTRILQ